MISLTILLDIYNKQTYQQQQQQQQQQLFSNLTESFVNFFVSLNDELNTTTTVSARNNIFMIQHLSITAAFGRLLYRYVQP